LRPVKRGKKRDLRNCNGGEGEGRRTKGKRNIEIGREGQKGEISLWREKEGEKVESRERKFFLLRGEGGENTDACFFKAKSGSNAGAKRKGGFL